MLIITHSRYLLNHCFNKIIHLENMELQEFDGRYIDYNFSLLESKIELQELAMDFALIIEDKTIRKMSMRKFRKIIYAKHFNRDYLEIEQKKSAVETKIELALKDNNFEHAKVLCEELEAIIKLF